MTWELDGAGWVKDGCPAWSDKHHLVGDYADGVCSCGLTYAQVMAQRAEEMAASSPASELSPPAPASATIDQGKSRHNAGKPPLHLLPLDGLVLVAWVLAFGSEKYSPRGWEQAAAEGVFSWADCVRACLSHLSKLMAGQRIDPESGLPHVAHLACNALFLCSMLARGNGRDDLPACPDGQRVPLCPADWTPGPTYAEAVAKVRAAKGTARG